MCCLRDAHHRPTAFCMRPGVELRGTGAPASHLGNRQIVRPHPFPALTPHMALRGRSTANTVSFAAVDLAVAGLIEISVKIACKKYVSFSNRWTVSIFGGIPGRRPESAKMARPNGAVEDLRARRVVRGQLPCGWPGWTGFALCLSARCCFSRIHRDSLRHLLLRENSESMEHVVNELFPVETAQLH